MARDPGTRLREAARPPRTAPDVESLWHRGRRRRRRRRAATVGAVAAVIVLVGGVALRWALPDPIAPIGDVPDDTVVLEGVDGLVGSDGHVWALRDGDVVRVHPDGPVAWDPPDGGTVCDLLAGAHGTVVPLPCDASAAVLVRPDLSTVGLPPVTAGDVVGAGETDDVGPWVVSSTGSYVTRDAGADPNVLDLGVQPVAATASDGIVWVAAPTAGAGTLLRVEDGAVTYRVPLTIRPTAAVATEGSVWVLGETGVARVDPGSNREVTVHDLTDPATGLATTSGAWAWRPGSADRLPSGDAVGLPPGTTTVSGGEGALFSLVDGQVVRTPVTSP